MHHGFLVPSQGKITRVRAAGFLQNCRTEVSLIEEARMTASPPYEGAEVPPTRASHGPV